MKKWAALGFCLCFTSFLAAADSLPKVQLIKFLPKMDLDLPVWMCEAPGDPSRVFVVEKSGIILVTSNSGDGSKATEFLNISDRNPNFEYEDGLLSIAFHPDFQKNHLCYIYYTQQSANKTSLFPYYAILSELKISDGDPNRADLSSERVLLNIPKPFPQHNGGLITFGPDGYLYLGIGDGGMGWDPYNNAQNSATLLGKIIRIDVNKRDPNADTNKPALPYGIPSDNPFVKEPDFNGYGARKEVYAYGLRNPWRYSFDRQTGELWAGDVGQDLWEEVDLIVKGGNYGWSAKEGAHYFKPHPDGAKYIDPVIEYPHRADFLAKSQFPKHAVGACVTGGYVYRGKKYPALRGIYIYGDYALGTIFGLRYSIGKVTEYGTLLEQPKNISSFAEDLDGELYVVAFDGHLFQIAPKE